uniref:Arginase n=1 Tax=viral metagenome TaxID=1070528 RepID=A0A6C0B548_9ZZZZ
MTAFTKFIGACCKFGQKKDGVQLGPKILLSQMNPNDIIFVDHFEQEGYNKLYNVHGNYLNGGWKPITVGGDHSISLSTIASSAKKYGDDLTVVWVDAHADIHTQHSSLSKNLHGMPLGSLLNYDNSNNETFINSKQLIYIGLRDVETHEKKIIEDLGIENYTMSDLKTTSLDEILTNIYKRSEVIHLSFDVDVMDPLYISCTGTPVKGGISYNDSKKIINKLSSKIISADVVEFNPLLGDDVQVKRESTEIIKLLQLFY